MKILVQVIIEDEQDGYRTGCSIADNITYVYSKKQHSG